MNIRIAIVVACAIGYFPFGLVAQPEGHGPFAELHPAGTRPAVARHVYRFHRRLPAVYHGYVIEIAASNYPLPRDFPLFAQFGKIYYDKVRRGGFSYLIVPQLRSRKEIERFFQTVIKPRVPEARLIRYKHGRRRI